MKNQHLKDESREEGHQKSDTGEEKSGDDWNAAATPPVQAARGHWQKHFDPESGAFWFYNSFTERVNGKIPKRLTMRMNSHKEEGKGRRGNASGGVKVRRNRPSYCHLSKSA